MCCKFVYLWPIMALTFALATGCDRGATVHSHGEGDALVWESKEKLADSDYEIWLGHHGDHFHGGDKIEPAVAITLAGKPVADAKVFNWLVDPADAEKSLSAEFSTVYEPETEEVPAHYAQGELTIPASAAKCVIRFRITIEGQDDYVKEISVNVGH